ncbi:MAG: RagB/SusD family nutrient uptake outer membrane protein, partial [Chitinophagaceae bacterium]
VESFEMLDDNTFEALPIKDGSGNPIYYDNPMDLFSGRDPRLAGTVVLPGAQGKNRTVDIFAGYQLGNGTVVTGNALGFLGQLPGVTGDVQLVGRDGPLDAREYAAQSGFYVRKFVDPAIGSGSRGTGSEVPWIRYRYAEVLLNAAEAAFELGEGTKAADYINQVRTRAGFTTPLTAGQVTFDRIVNERKVELAFEGHRLFDMKRWRLAHIVWDGVTMSEADLVSNIGSATKRSTQPFALWPYKIHNPGQPNHNKWIFKIVKNSIVTGSERFVFGNYYSEISADNLARNPKLVRQPNQ